jgi:hypothetical protein
MTEIVIFPIHIKANLTDDYRSFVFSMSMKTKGTPSIETGQSENAPYPPEWIFSEDDFIPQSTPVVKMGVSFETMLNESI